MIFSIDGGGTKTHLAVFDTLGHLLFESIGLGCNHQSLGVDTYKHVIKELIDQALNHLNITMDHITYMHLGISGADLPEDFDRLNKATKEIIGDVKFTVENDAWLILRSGLTSDYGAVCICGTGANALAIGKDGRKGTLRSLGFTLGTYGGGLDIAREALHYAFRAEELTYKYTKLMDEIPPLLGVNKMEDVVSLLYPKSMIDRKKLGQITGLTFKLAVEGDLVSQEIVKRIGMFLGYQTAGVIKQIGCENAEIPVVIGGRVFEEGSQHFIDEMLHYLKLEVPHAYLVRPKYLPVVGGFLRALDYLGIAQDREIEENLKEMRIKR